MEIFVDTNIFLRVLVGDCGEELFSNCRGVLEKVKLKKYAGYTSSLVLAEINWTLRSYYGLSREETAEAMSGIINLKNLRILDDFDAEYALELYRSHGAKFIDCMISSIRGIRTGGITVVSYDRDFDKLGVKRVEPAEFPAGSE